MLCASTSRNLGTSTSEPVFLLLFLRCMKLITQLMRTRTMLLRFHTIVKEIRIHLVPPSPPLPPPFPPPPPPPLSSSSSSCFHAGGLSRSRISEESGRPAMAAGSTASPKQDDKPPQLEQDACAPAVVCEPRTDKGALSN